MLSTFAAAQAHLLGKFSSICISASTPLARQNMWVFAGWLLRATDTVFSAERTTWLLDDSRQLIRRMMPPHVPILVYRVISTPNLYLAGLVVFAAGTQALQTIHDLLLSGYANHLHQHFHASQLSNLHTTCSIHSADVHQYARQVEHDFPHARVCEALGGEGTCVGRRSHTRGGVRGLRR